MRIEYSSMCLNEENYLTKIREARDFCYQEGISFGVQLHNSISLSLYHKLMDLKNELSFTAHSPVMGDFFLNLAGDNYFWIKDQVEKSCSILNKINNNLLFFHGFFMTRQPIDHDMSQYRGTLKKALLGQYALKDSFVMDPVFFNSHEYFSYKNQVKYHLNLLKKDFPEYNIALENDFVSIGSGLQKPEDITDVTDFLLLDLGHLWCSSLLHRFDYHEAIEQLMEETEIVGLHINHNLMTRDTPITRLQDSHTHLYETSQQNLKPVIKKLSQCSIPYFTLEIIDGDIKDIEIIINWLN